MKQILLKQVVLNGKCVDILIKDNLIAQIDDAIDCPVDEIIEGGGHLAAVPAFYNSHTHMAMNVLRGYADDMELFTWLSEHIWPAEAQMTYDDVYHGTRLAILEMIKGGTVFFNDSYWFPLAGAKAAEEMGVRAQIGLLSLNNGSGDDVKAEQNQALWDYREALPSRVRVACAPHAIYTVCKQRLQELAVFAKEHNLFIHIHAAETQKEVDDCLAEHGMTPIAYLHSLGILSPKTILAHCVHLNDDDRRIIAETGAVISHNPVSNQKLCSGIFDFEAARLAGCKITIGTDGCSSNNNLSMFEEMKFAALSAKIKTGKPTAGSDCNIYKVATQQAAEAFGINAGVIEVGKEADLLLVELDHAMMISDYSLISNLVYAADTSIVDTVICCGNVLMKHRFVPNEAEIYAEGRKVCAKLAALRNRA